jgi:hypothetical protein
VRRSGILVLLAAAMAGQASYDLGGPCVDDHGPGAVVEWQKAERAGAWDQAVGFARQSVRSGCSIEYRWLGLANLLVEANRREEAARVLAEMDARGFDLSPSMFGPEHVALRRFVETAEFKASGVGIKVEGLRKVSDDRRARFREMLAKLPANQKPAENYVAKETCPFECCSYREWTVEQGTDLVAAPESRRIVGRARKGTRVQGMTGEVHLQPQPVVVLRDGDFPKDSIAFVLDYEGEGYGHIWSNGNVVSVFLGVREYCFRVSDLCWGETLFPADQRRPAVWWVKIRLPNGTVGWSDKADRFGNKDLCG